MANVGQLTEAKRQELISLLRVWKVLLEWTAAFRERVECTEWDRYTTYVLLREALVQRYRGVFYAP